MPRATISAIRPCHDANNHCHAAPTHRHLTVPLSCLVVLVASLAVSLLAITPTANAETSTQIRAEIAEAQATRDSLYDAAEQASEGLNATRDALDEITARIDQTNADINARAQEIRTARETLSEQVQGDYKGGRRTIADMVTRSTSVTDLANRASAMVQMASATSERVATVNDAVSQLESDRQELETQKAEQERQKQNCEAKKTELDGKVAKADEYLDSLSSDLKDAIAREEAEAAARAAAEAQATRDTTANATNVTGIQTDDRNADAMVGNDASDDNTQTASDNATLSDARQKVLDMAYSQVGGRYVYGGSSFRATDCSGLVMQCYAAAGYKLPHNSEADASLYCHKPISQAVPGDIVWKRGHVGIYIGNGKTIEAFNPSRGITYGTIGRFSRCGSPIR